MRPIKYSVIVPVFGAENSLEKLHESIYAAFKNKDSFEIIYVDDCSLDRSWEILKKIKQSASGVTIIKLSKNFGQHGATICGFKYAKGDFIITIDDDMEVHPGEIDKLIETQKQQDSDLVYGIYKKLNQPFLRNILTKIYKLLSKVEGNEKGKGSSFRLLKRLLAKKLSDNHKQFVFIDELCLWYTTKLAFVQIPTNKEYIKKKRYKLKSLFSLTSTVIMFSSTFPLKLVTYIGLILSAVNFIVGLYYLIKKFFLRIEVPGYTSLIVSILFSTGLIIFCIGILAQYLNQSLKVLNNAPSYSEDEVIC